MENDDATRNIYPLFPGIDTTPFGGASNEGDDGWSAVPKRAVAGADAAHHGPLAAPRAGSGWFHRAGISRHAAWIAAAMIAGAALAGGRAILAPSASHNSSNAPGTLVASTPPARSLAETHKLIVAFKASLHPRPLQPHQRKPSHPQARPATPPAQPAPSTSSAPADSSPPQPSEPAPVQATSPPATPPASNDGGSSPSSHPAGPTSPIGIGTCSCG